jgi:hypothetical protein
METPQDLGKEYEQRFAAPTLCSQATSLNVFPTRCASENVTRSSVPPEGWGAYYLSWSEHSIFAGRLLGFGNIFYL